MVRVVCFASRVCLPHCATAMSLRARFHSMVSLLYFPGSGRGGSILNPNPYSLPNLIVLNQFSPIDQSEKYGNHPSIVFILYLHLFSFKYLGAVAPTSPKSIRSHSLRSAGRGGGRKDLSLNAKRPYHYDRRSTSTLGRQGFCIQGFVKFF